MKQQRVPVEAVSITDASGLDRIHVFWQDIEPGKGYVTIICYGAAWTAYWGAMGGKTIRQFFCEVDADYIVNRMGHTPHLKSTKRDLEYLTRIVEAVRASLRETGAECAAAGEAGAA